MSKLTHTDARGKAKMVDVGDKPVQYRIARATGTIRLSKETIALVQDNQVKKGDVLTVAQLAGIQAAKQTSTLIPLCHPLLLSGIDVYPEIIEEGVRIVSEVRCSGQTGVEMEALTAVSVALLTVYDMCKAVDKHMVIGPVYLLDKVKTDIG